MYNGIMGGGILPIAFYKGHPYFLFSREGMIQAEDPGKWSDFGGSKEKNETPKMTAIREGWEESNGFLGDKKDVRLLVDKFLLRKIHLNGYTTFIVSVDYNKKIEYEFKKDYETTLKSDRDFVKAHNGLYEKDRVKWIALRDLKKNVSKFRKWYSYIIYKIIDEFKC